MGGGGDKCFVLIATRSVERLMRCIISHAFRKLLVSLSIEAVHEGIRMSDAQIEIISSSPPSGMVLQNGADTA